MNKSAKVLFAWYFAIFLSGCSALEEAIDSQVEVPTLERQANRVAIGMTIVRENNIMIKKMKISADAKWPQEVSAPLTTKQKKEIAKILRDDPYFATVSYTEPIQRRYLGSGKIMNQFGEMGQIAAILMHRTISPLTYRALYKIKIFYGEDPKNWPDIFGFAKGRKNFEDFPPINRYGNRIRLREPQALRGDVYDNLNDAFIALMPINYQKDILNAKEAMLEAFDEVLALQAQKAQIQTRLEGDAASRQTTSQKQARLGMQVDEFVRPLRFEEREELKRRLEVLQVRIDDAKSVADEKEQIYFTLIDQAGEALKNDINLADDAYVALARNLHLVASEIESSSDEAYASFAIALAQLSANDALVHFVYELETLAIAKMYVPYRLQDKYDERIKRLVANVVYLLPNLFLGTYYAHKQSVLAQKYAEFTQIILDAYETKVSQDEAFANARRETDNDLKKEE